MTETSEPQSTLAPTAHDRHCFVVMPFGRDSSEQKWFRGWYEVVIHPAIAEAGYEPKLAAAEEQPGAINDEIRSHLALDPMVIVDLGGTEPEDDPNPNVMYELGIRHALGLPLVMMAWKGQRLPFDVSNQRIIMEDRDLIDLEQNRRKLVSFVRAAAQGKFYRPMDAVGRLATIQAASESLGEDSLMRALAQEVRDMRASLIQALMLREPRRAHPVTPTVKKVIRGKVFRKDLFTHFVSLGGTPSLWARVLNTRIDPDDVDDVQRWGADEWMDYLSARHAELIAAPETAEGAPRYLDEEILAAVRQLLPPTPWPSGIHREIAAKLGLRNTQASRYISEILRRHPEVADAPRQDAG